jgi:hypothetical protein
MPKSTSHHPSMFPIRTRRAATLVEQRYFSR